MNIIIDFEVKIIIIINYLRTMAYELQIKIIEVVFLYIILYYVCVALNYIIFYF